MTVGLILDEKGADVMSIDGVSTLSDAVKMLESKRVGALIVVDKGNPVAGMLSERDIIRALSTKGAGVLKKPVADFMTRKVITIAPETPVVEAMEIMTEKRVRHLPVLDGGKLRGLVSIGDVVKRRLSATEAEAQAMKEYISTG